MSRYHVHHRVAALGLTLGLLVAPIAMADDPIKVFQEEVPALKDGSRIAIADVERAILDACKRRRFDAKADAPGVISARWTHGSHWFDVSIEFTDSAYSIRYKNSERMDYDEKRQRIDDSYNEYVAALSEHIDADFERALKRLKVAQKEARKLASS
jgi:hypothetical protein